MATYKVVDADQLNADMTSVADSIRTKGGTTGALAWPDGYKTAIEAIQTGGGGGGGGSEEEWIGDGNTHIWIHLEEGRTSPMLGCCPNGTVTVDWGDGTTPDVLTGTSTYTVQWTPTHHYAAAGDYVITLTVDGKMDFGSTSEGSRLLRYSSESDTRNHVYLSSIQKVEIHAGATGIGSYSFAKCFKLSSVKIPDSVKSISSGAFYYCYSLASITIPDSVTSIGESVFYHCYSLASIKIPEGVTSIGKTVFYNCYSLVSVEIPEGVTKIGDSTFYYCYSIASIKIPEGVTSIGKTVFYNCYSLASIKIPSSVTSISANAFYYCHGICKVRFESATPPALSAKSAFSYLPTDCVISVPVGSLAAYTAATNYPDPATYTYIEEG